MNRRPVSQHLFAVCLAGLLGIEISACNQGTSEPKPLPPVRVALVQTITTDNEVRYSASIVPYSQVDLSFKSPGYLDSIRQVRGTDSRPRSVDVGDFVTKGTVLATVQQQEYQDKLVQAKAQADRARADYDRAKLSFERINILYSNQSATKPDYDTGKSQLESATAAVDAANASISEAQVALAYCELRAPFDGWIVKRSVDVGSLVGPATNGFSIADTHIVKAVFGLPDISMGRVRLGQQQTITTDALPGEFAGRVSSISAAADPKSRVYSVEVMIANHHNKLKSGMIASLYLGGTKLPRPMTAIPLAAVIRDPKQPNAFAVLVADGTGDTVTARSRTVELGEAYGNMISVSSGLEAGERVVTTGATLINSGDQVRIIP
jgi:RND family efflux transporter MFP subunit